MTQGGPIRLGLTHVSRRLGPAFALQNISFVVTAGECLYLTGPSGSGKTSLLRLIAGLDVPDAGTIAINGKTVSEGTRVFCPPPRGVGMVFQSLALWPHMTVRRNVYHGALSKLPARVRWELADHLLERLGIADLSGRFPFQLSGGEQQRVAIARALAANPEILLLDEPLAHLDRASRDRVRQLLLELMRTRSAALVFVSHGDGRFLDAPCQVLRLRDGRIADPGPDTEPGPEPGLEPDPAPDPRPR